MAQIIPFINTAHFILVLDQIVNILQTEIASQVLLAIESGKAQGTLTLDTQPLDGDNFTVHAKTYTLQSTLTNFDGNIQIGSTLADTQANIVSAFNLSGTAGVDYAALMTAHPTVDIADFINDKAILTAKTSGAAGNSIATTSSFSAPTNQFDAATLGNTRLGVDIDTDDFNFNVSKELFFPLDTLNELSIPLVNVKYDSSNFQDKTNKVDLRNEALYHIDIYVKKPSTDSVEGLTRASERVNFIVAQILYILKSPKYFNLGFEYEDAEGNLIKFIERRGFNTVSKLNPEDAGIPVENVLAARFVFEVKMIENLFDLQGNNLNLIYRNVSVKE
jgi:hypothetical protein